MKLPDDITAYRDVTALLDPYIEGIIAGRHTVSESLYSKDAIAPDLSSGITKFGGKLQSYAASQNVINLSETLSDPAVSAINRMLGGGWERGGAFIYPAGNGYMDWHTNHDTPGPRIYLVWCGQGDTSCFLSSPDGGKTIKTHIEPAGWSVNVFMLGDIHHPFWHAVSSGQTNRISFGFRHGHSGSQKILTGGSAGFSGLKG